MSDETGLPDIPAVEPVTTPAVPEKVFDKFWMRSLTVQSPGPKDTTMVRAEFRPYDGDDVKNPEVEGDIVSVEIPDLFGLISGACEPDAPTEVRQAVGQAMGAVIQALIRYGQYQKKFAKPTEEILPKDVPQG